MMSLPNEAPPSKLVELDIIAIPPDHCVKYLALQSYALFVAATFFVGTPCIFDTDLSSLCSLLLMDLSFIFEG